MKIKKVKLISHIIVTCDCGTETCVHGDFDNKIKFEFVCRNCNKKIKK